MFFKRNSKKVDFNAPLSALADEFLTLAVSNFEIRQQTLKSEWGFDSYKEWSYSQDTGIVTLKFADSSSVIAQGQILASHSPAQRTWEWAWNNPHVEKSAASDSAKVKELGLKLGFSYLVEGVVPVSSPSHLAYLCSLGVEATESSGIFSGPAGAISVYILVKNLSHVSA